LALKRSIYKPLGLLFLALGAAGLLLPILPTTPFILLAAWFFANSSDVWHRRLLDSEVFGPMIRNWEANRCISLRTKVVALVAMLVAGSASIVYAIDNPALDIVAAVLMATGAVTLLLIRTCPKEPRGEGNSPSP
jgi:uncharacterized membrane protein YbaN (DUF454 family)